MEALRIRYLLQAHMREELTATEQEELMAYAEKEEGVAVLLSELETMIGETTSPADFDKAPFREIWQQIVNLDKAGHGTGHRQSMLSIPWRRLVAAASIILVLGAAMLFWWSRGGQAPRLAQKAVSVQKVNDDVAPGANKATLTLADGTKMQLDSAANGNALHQGSVTVIKTNGKVTYKAAGAAVEVLYNTISVPRAGQYQLGLADGTKVWLNAESSLHFPTSFPGKERRVELKGEGYFEVARNGAQPFHVLVNGMDVEVLGTHFNINAYDDEPAVRTTLLEGAVKVTKDGKSGVLKPGQQATIPDGPADMEIREVNETGLGEVMAWKNGNFSFNQTDITSMMRQAQRWYDINVIYPSGIPADRFSGTISRDVNLSQFLKILDYSDIHASISGKTVTIKP